MYSLKINQFFGLLAVFCTVQVWAVGTFSVGHISGKVLNASNNFPVKFAKITLYSVEDSAKVKNAVTVSSGHFEIRNIALGRYFIQVECEDYKPHTTSSFLVVTANSLSDIGTIYLTPEKKKKYKKSKSKEETAKEKEKIPQVKKRIFGIYVDIQQNSGETALDVLKNMPDVEVSKFGKVSSTKYGGVKIYLDDKPLSSEYIYELDNVPSFYVDKIEFYSMDDIEIAPEDMTVVVNVVRKFDFKKRLFGYISTNLNADASLVNNIRQDSLKISYASPKFKLGGDLRYNDAENWSEMLTQMNLSSDSFPDATTQKMMQKRFFVQKGIAANLGFDFYLGARANLFFAATYQEYRENFKQPLAYEWQGATNPYFTERQTTGSSKQIENGLYGSFTKKFRNEEHRLTLVGDYRTYKLNDETTMNEKSYTFQEDDFLTPFQQAQFFEQEGVTAWADLKYSLPITSWAIINTGGKTDRIEKKALYTFSTDSLFSQNQSSIKWVRTRHDIYAGASLQFGEKTSYEAGVNIVSRQSDITKENGNAVEPDLAYEILPYALLVQNVGKSKISLSYTKKIADPYFYQLMPFSDLTNQYLVYKGNSKLTFETQTTYKLELEKIAEKVEFNFQVSQHQRENTITHQLLKNSDDQYEVNFINTPSAQQRYVSFSTWVKLTRHLSVYTAGQYVQNEFKGLDENFDVWDADCSIILALNSGIEFSVSGWYKSEQPIQNGTVLEQMAASTSVLIPFMKQKGYMQFGMKDILRTLNWEFQSNDGNDVLLRRNWNSNLIFAKFEYYFGLSKNKSIKPVRKHKNLLNQVFTPSF